MHGVTRPLTQLSPAEKPPSASAFVLPAPATSDLPAHRKGMKLMLDVRRDPLGYFTRLMRDEGSHVWMNLGGKPLLMLNDAASIQHVLSHNADNFTKASFNKVLRPLLGDGIFLSEGNVWRNQRREAAPVFAGGQIKDMTTQMVLATEEMLRRWEPHVAEGKPIDLRLEFMKLTLDILLRSLFHVNERDIAAGVQSALGVLLSEAEGRIWSPFNLPQSLVLRLPKYQQATHFLRGIVHELVTARREDRAYPDDLLSRLIDSYGDGEKDQNRLRDQVMSFLLAGHETTAHGLSWACYYLAKHPAEQKKLIAESDHVLQGAAPAFDHMRQLTHTSRVFKESLRLRPPVWTMSREAIADDQIPLDNGDKVTLPKGSAVMLCLYAVHRREDYWQDPEAFYPDRFLPDESADRPAFAWFPFGGGPRLCLGHRFAEIESQIALSMIAQKYRLSLLPGQNIGPEPIITLRPSEPVLVRAIPRTNDDARKPVPALASIPAAPEAAGKCPFHMG